MIRRVIIEEAAPIFPAPVAVARHGYAVARTMRGRKPGNVRTMRAVRSDASRTTQAKRATRSRKLERTLARP